ncbi:NeuD/PglB/VioB family sugar acetyltransferase [Ichthyenterobacterium sp. W332]|uniref:NeuD/PglB/VioB family sugar acetyltransferase n=1 Tax=Microcosmobacter mediterraneus TaxID=3075607 RepID=A0ABU2YKR3_9FLAO|nr:NeuD/PglB/VioB family sugar acetyltransferase [Ichthyenterobacterium sp. W332]MDT0558736.1 NeuD/PglB/VioB family sugar acetyltransferase [Ichthyenterobacterium sp. W332]
MKNILIYGASGHSKMIVDIIHKNKSHNIIGYIDTYKSIGEELSGYKILGNLDNLLELQKTHNVSHIVIGVGENSTRLKVWQKIKDISPNISFESIIHPSAILAENIDVPEGSVIMAGAIVNIDATIGKFCVLNTNSSLGHDSIMKDFSSIAPGVAVGGNVEIGYCSALCLKSGVIQNITIGDYSVIASGALVVKDIGDYKLAKGVPANIITERSTKDKYLGK